jgi:hypothetical protein
MDAARRGTQFVCNAPASILPEWFPGVGIDVESREVAAGDIDADAVTALKHQ